MIKLSTSIQWQAKNVIRQAKKASANSLAHAGSIIRKAARESMQPGMGKPSRPGTPPAVQTGRLKKSILFNVQDDIRVEVGPTGYGWYGRVHEFGMAGKPKRPFMKPALDKSITRIPVLWKGSLNKI